MFFYLTEMLDMPSQDTQGSIQKEPQYIRISKNAF